MQFLLMCCFDEARWNALPEERRAGIMQDYDQWVQEQVANGNYVTGGKLDASHASTTVRASGITDGPFSEAKEQIGGYHLVECESRDEAVRMAQRIPTLPAGGTVEVRPLLKHAG